MTVDLALAINCLKCELSDVEYKLVCMFIKQKFCCTDNQGKLQAACMVASVIFFKCYAA